MMQSKKCSVEELAVMVDNLLRKNKVWSRQPANVGQLAKMMRVSSATIYAAVGIKSQRRTLTEAIELIERDSFDCPE